MYEHYYGLRERPFDLTANPRFLLRTAAHEEALSGLHYGLDARLGIILLVGEAGTGKTTVLRATLASRPDDAVFVTVTNPILSGGEFYQHLARGFGLRAEAGASKSSLLAELTGVLEEHLSSGRATGLVIDEAHIAPHEILEEARLLSNLETDDHKLLPVVLAGQPELADRLDCRELRQLRQRVAMRCTLGALTAAESAAYIAGRIDVAGGDGQTIFTADAVELIHEAAGGLPRSINVICANALVTGFATDARPIGVAVVAEVCRDLHLYEPVC